jgi:hypothetical protein
MRLGPCQGGFKGCWWVRRPGSALSTLHYGWIPIGLTESSLLEKTIPHSLHIAVLSFSINGCPHWQTQPCARAGLPTIKVYAGTSLVITAPAPTIANSPIVTPARMTAPAPNEAPCLTRVFRSHPRFSYLFRTWGSRGDLGYRSFVKNTCGPTNTPSSSVTPSQTMLPFLMVTLSPTTAPDSMKQWSPMLQFVPMETLSIMWTKAQMRVPGPICWVSTIAVGCMNTLSIWILESERCITSEK